MNSLKRSLSLLGATAIALWTVRAAAQDTAFSYQGQLKHAGQGAAGSYVLKFELFDADAGGSPVGSPVVIPPQTLSNGVFQAVLDFGMAATLPDARWLEVSVRTNDDSATFTVLAPRQPLLGAPKAVSALTAGTASTVAAGAVTSVGVAAGAIGAEQLAAGAVVRSLNGLQEDVVLEAAGSVGLETNGSRLVLQGAGWGLTGNRGTTPGVSFLGTTDDQPLELRANGLRVLRVDAATNGALVTLVGGHQGNSAYPGGTVAGGGVSYGAGVDYPNVIQSNFGTIGGGMGATIGTNSAFGTVGGGTENHVGDEADMATISGGGGNEVQTGAFRSTIAGGYRNRVGPGCYMTTVGGGWSNTVDGFTSVITGGGENQIGVGAKFSTVGGGTGNVIEGDAYTSTIGGGGLNRIGAGAFRSLIAGGRGNVIGANASQAAILGGYTNVIEAGADGSVVVGGVSNQVAGAHALAAGYRARAAGTGAFVWADASEAEFASAAPNEFAVRATGGVRLVSGVDAGGAPTAGVSLPVGGGAWDTLSDRNAKTNFATVDPETVLAGVAALPLQTWSYRAEDSAVRHLGPTAQDFRAAFGLGTSERTISTVDADGVALAAIQGLERRVREQGQEIAALREALARLIAQRSPPAQ